MLFEDGWLRLNKKGKDTGRAHGSSRKTAGRWGGVEGKMRQTEKASMRVRGKTEPTNRHRGPEPLCGTR